MIETGWVAETRDARSTSRGRARRAAEVLDDYDRGGVLSEQLEDELCSELTGLWPHSRRRRGRPTPVLRPVMGAGAGTGVVAPPPVTRRAPAARRRTGRPHLALVHSVDRPVDGQSFTATSTR